MNRLSSKDFKKDLAEKFHKSLSEIDEIIESQFIFVGDVIRDNNPVEGQYKIVYLKEFGRFGMSQLGKRRVELIHNKHVEKGTLQKRVSQFEFIDDTIEADEDDGITDNS